MKDFKSPEELKEYLLNHPNDDNDDEMGLAPTSCYSLSWNKDHWIIRHNNKKQGVITSKDIPERYDLRENDLVFGMMSALRKGSLEGLNTYLEGLHENT